MIKVKRNLAIFFIALIMLMSIATPAMAKEISVEDTQKEVLTTQVTLPEIVGTLTNTPTKGSFYMEQKTTGVKIFFIAKGGSGVCNYDIELKGPNGFSKTIYVIGDGTARPYTVGTMNKGTYSYTITRTYGSGNQTFVMLIRQ